MEAEKQIQEMLKRNLITENDDCSFNSPLFLVKKKDGTSRAVVDLRKVNALIKPLTVTLPKIDEILQAITLNKPTVMTSADLFKGYYQVRCNPETSHITAFSSPLTGVSYKSLVCPMGLSISSGAFVYVLNKVFQDRAKFYFLFLYVDDLICVSKDISEHIEHLKILFETLRANSLVINPTKTSVAYSQLDFLGHTITKDGIKISESKIKAIKNIQPPRNRKTLQRLYGLLQFFRKNMYNFAERTKNMRHLLKQDSKFDWTEACDAELNDVKEALISNPILTPLQPTKQYH